MLLAYTYFYLVLFSVLDVLLLVHAKQFVVRKENFEGTNDEISDHAVKLAEQGFLHESLPLFRKVARRNPQNPQYWNNIGTTYMRIGLYNLARVHYEKSLEANPDWEDAHYNIKALRQYMPKDEKEQPYEKTKKMLHETRPIPTFETIEDLEDAGPEYTSLEKPFILKGVLNEWDTESFSLSKLRTHFGSERAEYYPRNLQRTEEKPRQVSFAQAISDMRSRSTMYLDKPGRYLMYNIGLLEWDSLMKVADSPSIPKIFMKDNDWLTSCFRTIHAAYRYMSSTHWRMLTVGTKGAGMFNHKDTLRTSSWHGQITGRKRWHLCSSAYDEEIGSAGLIDFFNPDYEERPSYLNVSCMDSVLNAGDVLYYPKDYWHQTENLDEINVGITGTLVTPANYREVSHELRRECSFPNENGESLGKPRLSVPADVCETLRDRKSVV